MVARVTSKYGPRDLFGRNFHHGIDYSAPIGSAVYTNKDVTVTYAGPASGYGNVVYAVDAQGTQYRYGHLDSIPPNVKVGATIPAGQQIATTGNTGDSTGAHLHYEVRQNGRAVDPETTIDPTTGKSYVNNASFARDGSSLNNSTPSKTPGYTPNGVDSGTSVAALGADGRRNSAADQRVQGTTTAPDLKGPQPVFGRRPPGIRIPRINPLLQYGDQ